MRVSQSVDQLHIHPHLIAGLLHAAFQDVCHSELLCDLGKILGRTLKMLSRGARDYFQVRHLRQPGQNFILNSFREISISFVLAQIGEGQDRD